MHSSDIVPEDYPGAMDGLTTTRGARAMRTAFQQGDRVQLSSVARKHWIDLGITVFLGNTGVVRSFDEDLIEVVWNSPVGECGDRDFLHEPSHLSRVD